MLPAPLAEFVLFGLKQAWACLFAALMLALLVGTHLIWRPDWPIHRYDALFVAAVAIQVAFLALRLESFDEAKVILIYHLVGTAMELFKTHMGSWSYPEPAAIRIGGVPLFTGFMYAAVGATWRVPSACSTCGSPTIRASCGRRCSRSPSTSTSSPITSP